MSPPAAAIRLVCSDLDGTLLGNAASTQRFRRLWESLPPTRPLLVYNTGRTTSDTQAVIQSRGLPRPDYIIGGVGTELFHSGFHRAVSEYNDQFGEGWDLARVEAIMSATPGIARQPPEFLHPYKSSWYLHRADRQILDDLRQRFRAAGLKVNLVYSSLRDLDVLPSQADKGQALAWLCRRLIIALEQVLVAGDSANDTAMLLLPGVKRIVVANAHPEVFSAVLHVPAYVAHLPMADGVIEGLEHFGLLPRPRSTDVTMPLAQEQP